jgi:hypothetical protein
VNGDSEKGSRFFVTYDIRPAYYKHHRLMKRFAITIAAIITGLAGRAQSHEDSIRVMSSLAHSIISSGNSEEDSLWQRNVRANEIKLSDWSIAYSPDSLLEVISLSVSNENGGIRFERYYYKGKETWFRFPNDYFTTLGHILSFEKLTDGSYITISEGGEGMYINTLTHFKTTDTTLELIPIQVPAKNGFQDQDWFCSASLFNCGNELNDSVFFFMKYDKQNNLVRYRYTTPPEATLPFGTCATYEGELRWKDGKFYRAKERKLKIPGKIMD